MRRLIVPTLLALSLMACMDASPPQAKEPPPRTPTVLDDQLEALDKANAVEGQVLDQKKAQDKQFEDQGG